MQQPLDLSVDVTDKTETVLLPACNAIIPLVDTFDVSIVQSNATVNITSDNISDPTILSNIVKEFTQAAVNLPIVADSFQIKITVTPDVVTFYYYQASTKTFTKA